MFSGIITDLGRVSRIITVDNNTTMRIACHYDASDLQMGESIACAGVCLSVVDFGATPHGSWFDVQLSPETMAKTTCAQWVQDQQINLERALRLCDRLGGHLVQGHIDCRARITHIEKLTASGDTTNDDNAHHVFGFACDGDVMRYMAVKGSVCVDGISLTINSLNQDSVFVNIVPITMQNTSLQWAEVGTSVNIEIDMFMRYCERLMETSPRI